jgi:Rrf2 family transcriptional repressor of oqxAB
VSFLNAANRVSQLGPPRFAVAVHILVWLARSGCSLSSSVIADQVKSHATFMRRVLATLAQAGIVEAREGRDGGYSLKVPADSITLADVFMAVRCEPAEADAEGDGDCGAQGAQLDQALLEIMNNVDRLTIEYLRGYTIAGLI